MTTEALELLVEAGREALAQSLRQWAMHANDKRHEPDDVDLGVNDEMEDRAYNHALATLKRLGAAADELQAARLARKPAFDSSAWLDLLAVSWEAEAELLEGRLAHDPFRKRPENISCEEAERMRVEINRLRVCALELREWLVGLASKSND